MIEMTVLKMTRVEEVVFQFTTNYEQLLKRQLHCQESFYCMEIHILPEGDWSMYR